MRNKTVAIRLPEDLAEMVEEVLLAERIRNTEFFTPLVEGEIRRRHEANLDAIKVLRKARERRAKGA